MQEIEWMKSFHTAAALLPERLWRAVYTLDEHERLNCEEIRVRLGRPLCATVDGRAVPVGDGAVVAAKDELDELLARATECSVHTYLEQLRCGFLTTRHGHRLGICAQAPEGDCRLLRGLSSVNIRIARQMRGLGADLNLTEDVSFDNTLILGPPGSGKTTLLRELCRRLSARFTVAIADERYEIAACMNGIPRFDIGSCDVLSGGCKRETIPMLLRAMSPQILALDEITQPEDCRCLEECIGCGCGILATAHGTGVEDLYRRPLYRRLMEQGVFQRLIVICQRGSLREYRMEAVKP